MISPTSNQKNILKEYLEKGLPEIAPFPSCIEIITTYCCSFPTRIPYPLFKETHRIFWELPPGKVAKNGKVVTQSAQKGNTCTFYATRRLLRYEQTQTPHHALCSQRRKAMTAAGHFSFPMAYHQARSPANETFLKSKNLDPIQATRECWLDLLKLSMAELPTQVLTREFFERIMQESEPVFLQQKPWYRFEHMELAVEQATIKGYGLQTVPCSDLLTVEGLRKTLLKGPVMITGNFGSAFYFNKQPIKLAEKIGPYHLHGWGKNTPFTGSLGLTHTIVLVGMEIKPQNTRVYWIDPMDPSDPHQPETQRILIHTFETIVTRMTSLVGIPLSQLSGPSKKQVPGALYNPQLTMV